MRFNYQYYYDENTNKIHILGLPFKTKYVEVPRENRFNKLYSYVLIKMDLLNAIRYLNVSLHTEESIIKEGMFRSALILYMKCFSNSKSGRTHFSPSVVYRDVPQEPIACHEKFENMRNKYIAHDEKDFLFAKLGMVLNEDEEQIVGVVYPELQAKFDYDENIAILQTLCSYALLYTEAQTDIALGEVQEYLSDRDYDIVSNYKEMTVVSEGI